MERYSQRDSVQLGYNLQRPFLNSPSSSPRSQYRSSDIDFKDVFGGPPRRSSLQEGRVSLFETAEGSDDDAGVHSRRWSGLCEKPVFGDGASRKQYPSNDFFDDIFGGNESLTSSPRKNDRDSSPFMSGSRFCSPARSLQPRTEPFASPAQFSLPAKLVKGTDLPTFGSSTRYHHKNKDGALHGISYYGASPLSRSSSQRKLAQEEERYDVYSQSTLEPSHSNSSEEFSNLTKPDEVDKCSNLKEDSNTSEVAQNGGKFHFSIYKWATKGVAVPLRGRSKSRQLDKGRLQRCSNANEEIVGEDSESKLPSPSENDASGPSFSSRMTSDDMPFMMELDTQEDDSISENSLQSNSVHGKGLSGQSDKRVSAVAQEIRKAETKSLRSLLSDGEQDVDEMSRKNGLKDSRLKNTKNPSAVFDVSEKVGKQYTKTTRLTKEEGAKTSFQGSPKGTQDNTGKAKGRGKVKEFVKIFNQEATNGHKSDFESQNQTSKWKETNKFRKRDEESTTMTNEKKHFPNGNISSDDPIMVDEYMKQSKEKHPEARTKNPDVGISSGFKGSSTSTAEVNVEDADQSYHGNFVVTDLLVDEKKLQQTGSISYEEIQAINTKIREWSSGKEGNIRSLLSTLQYVLWTGSGWKPVPLVDIIEGNAVKRSYQKALLCLHPDKLQQKGATPDQKHTAEKVFDILKEAWDQFNKVVLL